MFFLCKVIGKMKSHIQNVTVQPLEKFGHRREVVEREREMCFRRSEMFPFEVFRKFKCIILL